MSTQTQQEMNIALCEKRGWVLLGGDLWGKTMPGENEPTGTTHLPDHFNGESALYHCHEAEKLLTSDEGKDYLNWLGDCDGEWASVHATAAQRAEALCRVWWPERFAP